jgi:tetratricopeptide (TPR) repeat protein
MARDADLLARAERCHRAGDLLGAGNLYGEILEQQPDNASVWGRLGEVYQAIGQPEDAVDSYRRALAGLPDDAGLHSNLGAALMALGRLDEAADAFAQALRLRPGLAEAASNFGLVLLNQNKLTEAVLQCREAARLRPDLAEVHNNLGLALLNPGRGDEALPCFRQAIALRPDLADAPKQPWPDPGRAGKGRSIRGLLQAGRRARRPSRRGPHEPGQCLEGPGPPERCRRLLAQGAGGPPGRRPAWQQPAPGPEPSAGCRSRRDPARGVRSCRPPRGAPGRRACPGTARGPAPGRTPLADRLCLRRLPRASRGLVPRADPGRPRP